MCCYYIPPHVNFGHFAVPMLARNEINVSDWPKLECKYGTTMERHYCWFNVERGRTTPENVRDHYGN